MKLLLFLSSATILLALACSKHEHDTHSATDWYYNETQCSDPWYSCQILTDPQSGDACIKSYLRDSMNIQFTDFHIMTEQPQAVCLACNCVSGRVIHLNADAQYDQKLLSLGFVKQ